jgi:type IV pilus assembly protein PilQ
MTTRSMKNVARTKPQQRAAFHAGVMLALIAGSPMALGQSSVGTPALPDSAQASPDAGLERIKPGQGDGGEPKRTAPRPPPSRPAQNNQDGVETTAQPGEAVFDLAVNDEDLGRVLEMLGLQTQRNIVTSKNVSARVTFNGYGVTFYEALDAILHVNGYGYIEEGNFIYVYTIEEIDEMKKAMRVKVSKAVRLNYLNSIDAAEFVKPLLSAEGQIKTNGKAAAFNIGGPNGADEFVGDATLVIYDYEENVAEIEKLVGQLDTRPQQVLVEATILQTSLTEANAFGVDFSVIGDMDLLDFVGTGGPLSVGNALISGRGARLDGAATVPTAVPNDLRGGGVTSSPGNTAGPGTFKLGVYYDDVAVFLRMLDEVSDTTILSNPKILALNRQSARVLVGRKVGYLSSTSTDTATTQTVEFLDTGTQLNFRPFVSADGWIRMELKPQVSEAIIRETRDSSGSSVTIPDEVTNELVTNVMVRDGQTIVLGGLFREETKSSRRQVPFLGDIPILGNAFRGRDDSTNRSEIIFLITPTIVNDQQMAEAGKRGLDFVRDTRDSHREGLLPWSRDRMSGQLLVEAERLATDGNTDRALFNVRRSLQLNPAQPDALRLRDRLMKERKAVPGRSGLESIIRNEASPRAAGQQTDTSWLTGAGETTTGTTEQAINGEVAPAPAPATQPAFSSSVQPMNGMATPTNFVQTQSTVPFDPSWEFFYLAPNPTNTTFTSVPVDLIDDE